MCLLVVVSPTAAVRVLYAESLLLATTYRSYSEYSQSSGRLHELLRPRPASSSKLSGRILLERLL